MQKAETREKSFIELQKNVKSTLKGKKATVVGLARSGVGAANLLAGLGAEVTVTDIKGKEELKEYLSSINSSVKLAIGEHPEHVFLETDLLVVSPGIRLDIPQILRARAKGIPVIGELELAYQILKDFERGSNGQSFVLDKQGVFLAVTGTNGKSTTTALLASIMRESHFNTIVGGNIGNALTDEIFRRIRISEKQRNGGLDISKMNIDYIIAEVSSFQLESIQDFRPRVATILNITPDHMDRYRTFEEYISAKARISENQKENDFLVLNWDDPTTVKLYNTKFKGRNNYLPRVYFFSRKEAVRGVYYSDGTVYHNFPSQWSDYPEPLINASEIKMQGIHNLENAMAASAMALLAKSPIEAVKTSLVQFTGLEHRLEFVREVHGVQFFNDSKGTNVGAVIKSLEGFEEPIVLIAGGRDKAGDFSLLRPFIKDRVKALVLIGEARWKIRNALGDLTRTFTASDLREAVNVSQGLAVKGDIVLLSPACASFDMFIDFEDRGRKFKEIVMELK